MPHCQKYWEIAQANADLFTEIRRRRALQGETDDKEFDALERRYLEVMRQLDEHASKCPTCQPR